ncbi:ribosomal protein L7/L12 [Microbacterium sp.]|uniref:ribosomal protein L7/L12 n=1 Tax=Microbacterium sp. TaxID=51671 RepID=UPI0027351175|nr:ribosomal protein L7/L12 [Microbacterium sp.]MDP3952869.1 ribosomal protein L7/L12 [Microbacterium sp.]
MDGLGDFGFLLLGGALVIIGIVVGVFFIGAIAWNPRQRTPMPLQSAVQPTVVTTETAQDIENLLSQGQKIQAIKLMREQTGLGLAEAKGLIDTWPNGVNVAQRRFAPYVAAPTAAVPVGGGLSPDVVAQIDHLVAAGQKIHAIKLYRTSTGVGLKEAKETIDVWPPRGNAS